MANEVFTFSEESMRKLVEAYRESQREYANLRRTLAHFSTRRHQTVYMPGIEQVALARFQAHASPDPVYAYPARTASTQDRIFPAYIQNDVTWIDDPTDPSWSVTGIYTWTGTDKEAVFVQSLRNWWIPNQTELLPVFKINGKWFCDYVKPAGPAWALGTLANLTTTPTAITWSSIDYGAGGHTVDLDVATGKFYFRRGCFAKVTIDATFWNVSLGPAVEYYGRITNDGDAALGCEINCTFPKDCGSTRHNVSRTYCFSAGAGLYFRLLAAIDSGTPDCDLLDINVTIDTQNHF